ncbi:pyruvate, water dikinase regulatory protein [Macrococcus carouselicus]|uniref:Putative pyruvate, phosphate dikinase regulatory protein n=1 Tax=Macrococcus carouselicus TaxID=69969 RepID=A0A9Q8FRD8_9STAP|nr:pyruvate, water dikinase regulatory protein [Macrococcus carouselicus]TDM04371.1 kinase/pyrophosphorylase [Macrococcus carouselicus]
MDEIRLIIASDSVGETAELVTKACTSQFNQLGKALEIVRLPYIETNENVDEVIAIAREQQSIVIYTLVKPKIRAYMKAQLEQYNLDYVDIMGPLMMILTEQLNESPLNEPGVVHKLDEDYFKKIEAIEFAVKYDDGRDPRGLPKADIVLVGVSRTSKTPLSQYLAHKRFKVMNVPLVPEVDPPGLLFEIDPAKCIALKIDPEKLNAIRKERLVQLGLNDDASYAQDQRIHAELEYFEKIVSRIGCPVIDVSNKAIEETANEIIKIVTSNKSFKL